MILPVFRRTLADTWRGTLGWTLGLAAAIALYLPLFPSIGGEQMAELVDTLPPSLTDTLGFDQIASGAGYAQSTFFGLIGFLLLTIATAAWGAAAIGGAEESGRLELTLAHGVGRVQYALESALAILVRLLWLTGVAMLLVLALDEPSELGLEAGNVVAVTVALLALSMLTGSLALAGGALAGRRGVGIAVGAAVAVAGYVFNAIGNQSEDLEWLHAVSPYAWAYGGEPLAQGWDGGGLALLGGFSVLGVLVATIALQRRDVTG